MTPSDTPPRDTWRQLVADMRMAHRTRSSDWAWGDLGARADALLAAQ